MTSTTKTEVYLNDIYDAMRECFRRALAAGRNWHAVTVWPQGDIVIRDEVSPCYSESEYFKRGDCYPLTVWHTRGDGGDLLSEDEIEAEVDAFDPQEQFRGLGGVEQLVKDLEAAGYVVVE